MTTGISCVVLVDGVRAQDGSPGDDLTQAVVLENLSVSWGRSDTMSQPDADSCTFDVMDVSGDGFVNSFRTGSRIDVLAYGMREASGSETTFENPGFETTAVTWSMSGGTATRSAARVQSGANALAVVPSSSTAPAVLLLAPAPFESAGTNPDAWDDIPTTTIGETWTATVGIWLPSGGAAQVQAVMFTGPYVAAGTTVGTPVPVVGTGEWQQITFSYLVQQNVTRWVGLQISYYPRGPEWNQLPAGLLWNAVNPALTWNDFGTMYVDDAQITAPETGTSTGVLVFAGRVTELTSQWDDSANAPVVSVVANGFTADLQNRSVGDEPWPVENVDARSNRIVSLAGLPITLDIDDEIKSTLLSWRDVDSQGALGLLQSVAVSVDAVLWPAVHAAIGAYLRMEDPSQRESLLHLVEAQIPGPPLVTVRRNRALNPTFETNATYWQPNSGATIARSTAMAHSGTASLAVTTTGVAAQGCSQPLSGVQAVTSLAEITCSAWVFIPVGISARIGAQEYSPPSVAVGTTYGPTIAGTGEWVRLSATRTPAAIGNWIRVTVFLPSAHTATTFYVDDVLVEEAPTVGDYFDGSTPDTATTDNAWTGVAHASTSTATTTSPTFNTIIVIEESDPDGGIRISSCDVLRDPVQWVQSVSDIATRVSTTWKLQGVDDEGNPTTTDVTERIVNAELEQRHGTRAVSVSTELQSAADAIDVASKVLARTSSDAWRAEGLTLDDDDIAPTQELISLMLDLLDGTSRIGSAIVLTDLPQWAPAGESVGVYLEGGTYSFVGGRWVLDLVVSSSDAGLGQSAEWNELDPDWTWNQFDPAITWDDLRGVSV